MNQIFGAACSVGDASGNDCGVFESDARAASACSTAEVHAAKRFKLVKGRILQKSVTRTLGRGISKNTCWAALRAADVSGNDGRLQASAGRPCLDSERGVRSTWQNAHLDHNSRNAEY